MEIRINDVVFDVEYSIDRDGMLDEVSIVVNGSDQELSSVLSEEVLKDIDQACWEDAQKNPPEPYDYEER